MFSSSSFSPAPLHPRRVWWSVRGVPLLVTTKSPPPGAGLSSGRCVLNSINGMSQKSPRLCVLDCTRHVTVTLEWDMKDNLDNFTRPDIYWSPRGYKGPAGLYTPHCPPHSCSRPSSWVSGGTGVKMVRYTSLSCSPVSWKKFFPITICWSWIIH